MREILDIPWVLEVLSVVLGLSLFPIIKLVKQYFNKEYQQLLHRHEIAINDIESFRLLEVEYLTRLKPKKNQKIEVRKIVKRKLNRSISDKFTFSKIERYRSK